MKHRFTVIEGTKEECKSLVPSPASARGVVGSPKRQQLTLPFESASEIGKRVIIVSMDSVHGRRLNESILTMRPKTVLDLRHAARFTLYGTDRDTVFRHLSVVQSHYRLSSFPWHQFSMKDFMDDVSGLVPQVRHELVERQDTPVMMLVPRPEHAAMLQTYVNRLLSERSMQTWSIESLT